MPREIFIYRFGPLQFLSQTNFSRVLTTAITSTSTASFPSITFFDKLCIIFSNPKAKALTHSNMAAFSYQYHPFLVDSTFLPNIDTGSPSQIHLIHQESSFNVTNNQLQDTISCVDHSSKISISDNEPSVTKNLSPQSSMVVDKLETGEQVTQKVTPMERKRRTRHGSCLSNPQSEVNLSSNVMVSFFAL